MTTKRQSKGRVTRAAKHIRHLVAPTQDERIAQRMEQGLTSDEASVLTAIEQLGREPMPAQIFARLGDDWHKAYGLDKESTERRFIHAIDLLVKGGYIVPGRRGGVMLRSKAEETARWLR
jgi:hypothetical protein